MDQGWTIDIDAAGDPAIATDEFDAQVQRLTELLEPHGGAISSSDRRDRFGARFSLDTESVNPVEVLEDGLFVFHDAAADAGLPPFQVVRCEILTYAEDDATSDDDSDHTEDASTD